MAMKRCGPGRGELQQEGRGVGGHQGGGRIDIKCNRVEIKGGV